MSSIPKDIEIAQSAEIKTILEIAEKAGVAQKELVLYGEHKAKVKLSILERLKDKEDGYYIDVTAITPTPLGEGKTTTAIGLTQGLGKLGENTIICIRQPSMGPTFGIKGGAAGGGYSQVIPMEDFNLHLTGDMHAISAAHNLIAAALDARIMHERNYNDKKWEKKGLKRLNINPNQILWRRVVDINDRALRNIVIGLGSAEDGYPRESGFDITPASELMAILALSKNIADMKKRIGKAIVAFDKSGEKITVDDLGVTGAATVIMKDAIMPNLMQTLEGQPAFVHAGPFANIAHGNSSIVADYISLKLADYTVTESGFGADIGMEKFFNIKCRASGKMPNAVVLVATVRALKMHGGAPKISPSKTPKEYLEENIPLLEKGCSNLIASIQIAKQFGVPVVVALNSFPTDSINEIEFIYKKAMEAGAFDCVLSDHFCSGGRGAIKLAEAVREACKVSSSPKFLYDLNMPIKDKIYSITSKVYGAKDVSYSAKADKQIKQFEKNNLSKLPLCMAKTQYSLSDDPSKKGAPKDFTFHVREIRISAGAGFLYAICGDMKLMPGLPSKPAFYDVDIDANGKIKGLF